MESIAAKVTTSSASDIRSDNTITKWLSTRNQFWFTVLVSVFAFGLYTSVYAFRKTFSAATFDGYTFYGLSYKVLMVIFQVCGYAASKFIGIKLIAELQRKDRRHGILLTTFIAAVTWLLFAFTPPPFNLIFLFINGLVLGLVWGMVFGYLEGRKSTEALGAVLSVSFIFSSGLCRSVGAYITEWNVSEFWMPFIACCFFLPPLLLFLFFLDKVPNPTQEDEALRTKREPMNRGERRKFVQTFLPGIVLFVTAYILLTVMRDLRDNFSAEVWQSLGVTNPAIFTRTEIPVSIAILLIIGSMIIIKNNWLAFMLNHIIILIGMVTIGISAFLFYSNDISSESWMILTGLGLYLGYVPFNCIFFDRMLATFRYTGTVGFIMYVADSFGYLGSVGVMFYKELLANKIRWIDFFITSGYIISVAGSILVICSLLYFYKRHLQWSNR